MDSHDSYPAQRHPHWRGRRGQEEEESLGRQKGWGSPWE